MYARVTPTRFDPDKEDEVVRIIFEQLLPGLRQVPGLRHYFATADRSRPGHGAMITVWDTVQQAESVGRAFRGLLDQFQTLGLAVEPSQVQEVVAHS